MGMNRKKYLALALALACLIVLTSALQVSLIGAPTSGEITINLTISDPYMSVNGQSVEVDPGRGTVPVIVDSRTLLPIRAVIEAIGGQIAWNADIKLVTIDVNGNNIKLSMAEPVYVEKLVYSGGSAGMQTLGLYEGSKTITVNDQPIENDVPAMIINARTFMPLRFVAENVGAQVSWEQATKTVTVVYNSSTSITTPVPVISEPIAPTDTIIPSITSQPPVTVPVTQPPATVTLPPASPTVAPTPTEAPISFIPMEENKRIKYNFNYDWKFAKAEVADNYKTNYPELAAEWEMNKKNVAGAEKIAFDDSSWDDVSLPHTFNDVDTFDDYVVYKNQGTRHFLYNPWQGWVWYRKHFTVPQTDAGKKVLIEFEGARNVLEVYLNGEYVGIHENGVTPAGFDLTPYVKYGEDNVIAVKVNNDEFYQEKDTGTEFQWFNPGFNPHFGGIVKNVHLHVTDKIYQTLPLYKNLGTTGVYVYPTKISISNKTADINIEAEIKNEYAEEKYFMLEAYITDLQNNLLLKIDGGSFVFKAGDSSVVTAKGSMTDVEFWSDVSPTLYNVYTVLKVDGKAVDVNKVRTGFRKLEFRGGEGTGGVYLNDEFVYLKGFAQRTTNEWAGIGQAHPDWMHDYTMQLMKDSSANYVRWMHVAAAAADIRASDERGVMVIQPAADREDDLQGRQWEQRIETMRDSMVYFRNCPSIVCWEAGNNGISQSHMTEMANLRDEWDPHGMRGMGGRSQSRKALADSDWYGTMTYTDDLKGNRVELAPIIETENSRHEAPRRVWDDYSPPDFDYVKDENAVYDLTSEDLALVAIEQYWRFYKELITNKDSKALWSGYASIIFSDTCSHGRQNFTEVGRVTGKTDAVRIPKQAYYCHRVMHNDDYGVPDIHIIGHWTYPEGTVKNMYVASNTEEVELFVNGQSLGRNSTPVNNYQFTFENVAWVPGTIKAVGYNGGVEVCSTEKKTAGTPAKIRLTPTTGPNGFLANGSDILMIDVEVVDAEGNRYPTDQARIDFTMDGPGIWRGGYNSGIEDSVNKKHLLTEAGINRVFVRSTLTPGTITVSARRDGSTLEPATISVQSLPVEINGGLSLDEPN